MNIKEYRKANKLSLPILSQRLGYSTTHISMVANGHRQPSFDMIVKLIMISDKQITLCGIYEPFDLEAVYEKIKKAEAKKAA